MAKTYTPRTLPPAVQAGQALARQSLRRTRRARRPVTVILIACGVDADVPALEQASRATSRRTYVCRDPADIGMVFLAPVVNR